MSVKTVDKVERIGGAQIQHGPLNDRIYLMKLRGAHPAHLMPKLFSLARKHGYSKIFAKVPTSFSAPLLKIGFKSEARVPELYRATDDGVFLGYYLDPRRESEGDIDEIERVLEQALLWQATRLPGPKLEAAHTIKRCRPKDAEELAAVFNEVFPTYPFPIGDPEYLRGAMDARVEYYGVYVDNQLVSAAAAEFDDESRSVEMTDFATLPAWRGKSFAAALLARMETRGRRQKTRTAFTIARAISPGINITFAKRGFQYGGRLKNNTNISGRIESMNVWYKSLVPPPKEPVSTGE